MAHARLAPSKAGRVLVCPASVEREAVLPDDAGGPKANQGTNAHFLLEQALMEDRWPPKVFGTGGNDFLAELPHTADGLPAEIREMSHDCFWYAKRRQEELGPGTQLVPESKVDPQYFTGRSDSPGTADVILVSGDLRMVEIVDLKTGGSLVEADSPQLRLYALGVLAQYVDRNGNVPFSTVRLTVYQPARPGDFSVERYVDMTPQDLIQWAHNVWLPAANESDDPNARAKPTDEGCKYCKAKKHGTCPEYKASMAGAAVQLFGPVVGNAHSPSDAFQSEFAVDAMTPVQVGQFLEIWPLIKARGKDIEERAVKMLKAREPIPGFKLVEGRKTRAWANEDEDQIRKFSNAKLTKKEIFVEKLRTPAQMKALGLSEKKWASVEKHIVTKPGGLTVVPIDDKRADAMPAVTFAPVEEPATAQEVIEHESPAENTQPNLSFLSL